MQRITEKSDVYSYGVILLEVLTGRHPLDPSLPGGMDLVQWVRAHLQRKLDPVHLLDGRLLRRQPEHQLQEMLQALSISVLCVGHRPDDRPAMNDVVALLEEVRRPANDEQTKEPATAYAAACAVRDVTLQGSSNCSFAMSEYSS